MRKRKPGESIAALADDLRQMAQRAYTDLDAKAQEVLALNQLYKSVPAEVKYQCTNQDCKNVTDAVEIIERYEAILGDGTDKKKFNVRRTSENDSNRQNDDRSVPEDGIYKDNLEALTRRIAELENQRHTQNNRRTELKYKIGSRENFRQHNDQTGRRVIKCFLCDEPGHICKNCPIFIKCKEDLRKSRNGQSTSTKTSQTNTNQSTRGGSQGNFRNPLAH